MNAPQRSGVVGVLLAGGLKPSPLQRACDRHVLDLHVAEDRTLLQHWLWVFGGLREAGVTGSPITVLHSPEGFAANTEALSASEGTPVTIRREVDAFRGPAGAIRDLCDGAPTAREIIAVEAVRYIGSSVAELLELHRRTGAWATLGVNPDGSPGGVYILSPEAVDLVPRSGFLDLKEQLLRKVRDVGGEVRGQFLPSPGGLSLRTRAEFLRAIASIQGEDPEGPGAYGTRAEAATEAGSRVGSVVSREANVHEHATLLHSLAMPGSTVEAGAVVARSILLPGATVVKGGSLVDAVATASGVVKDAPQRGLLRKRA